MTDALGYAPEVLAAHRASRRRRAAKRLAVAFVSVAVVELLVDRFSYHDSWVRAGIAAAALGLVGGVAVELWGMRRAKRNPQPEVAGLDEVRRAEVDRAVAGDVTPVDPAVRTAAIALLRRSRDNARRQRRWSIALAVAFPVAAIPWALHNPLWELLGCAAGAALGWQTWRLPRTIDARLAELGG